MASGLLQALLQQLPIELSWNPDYPAVTPEI